MEHNKLAGEPLTYQRLSNQGGTMIQLLVGQLFLFTVQRYLIGLSGDDLVKSVDH
ncbi:hypothetical protein VSWAT3_15474 [Vibrionales bacterium SWAT-3]|nr:hypothetical protein VSWAT3_15474 [Vibrionales bacterium SWAT-3]